MKKMTLKEFKAALEAGGMSLEAWGWEGILNSLICEKRNMADSMARHGLNVGALALYEESNTMHMILASRGYYDDLKKTTA